MSRSLKENDFIEFSKLYEAEFNQPDIHDRILVFDVVGSGSWLRSKSKQNIQDTEISEDEVSTQGNEEEIKTGTRDNEEDQTDEEKTTESTGDYAEKEPESDDCEIGEEQNQEDENKACDEISTDDHTTANKTAVANGANNNESALKETVEENVEITRNTSNEDDSKCLQDAEIVPDTSNANLNNTEQSEDDSENYDGSSNPINEDEIIREHKFYIHSSWLAVQSTYFRSMFFSGMKESNAREVHVQISISEEKSHLILLEAMYKIDILEKASVDELLQVLRLAHKYDVKFVFKKCKYCLQAAVVSLEICEQIMRFVEIDNDITDVKDLASTMQSFLATEFSPLDKTWQTTSFEELCEPSLRYLLSSDNLVAKTENTVFHALIHWIKQRGLDNVSNDKGLPSLLSVVRFEVMPIDYLYNIAQHNPVAKKLVNFNQYYLRGISYHALSDEMRQRLPRQSLKRKDDGESLVAYTWVIPIKKFRKIALLETKEELISDEFWFCGYKMMLTINEVQPEEYNPQRRVITFHLVIINLTQRSVVRISWQPTNQLIGYSPNTMHTFKTDAQVSACKIHFDIQNLLAMEKTSKSALAPAKKSAPGSIFPAMAQSTIATGFNFSPAVQLKPATTTACFSFGGNANPPQPENPTKPSISINVKMNMH